MAFHSVQLNSTQCSPLDSTQLKSCLQGGLAGLMMRLKQDGHGKIELHGPPGRTSILP